ncbi:MAG: hypothetical protein OEZ36_03345, partial [Spirochaetota bacterium]|nr:hypothetical protein [Spirochaetota bacterium]
LQAKAQSKYSGKKENMKSLLKDVGFNKTLIIANIKRLQSTINKLVWQVKESEWLDYSDTHSYDAEEENKKKSFVRSVVQNRDSWGLVWDIGANVGIYSKIAAERARVVVSMDIDHATVERLYLSLKKENNKNIIPLVMNIAKQSPGVGWRGLERKSLSDRGKPELVLCLALIHHVVISSNIPMSEFISWLASLGGDVIIEFITKKDEMVQTLLQNKEDIYLDYDIKHFEECLLKYYTIDKKEEVKSGKRFLYHAKKIS